MKYLKLTGALAAIVLLTCAALPGGGNPTQPDGSMNGKGLSERVFGTIEFYGETAQVEVPISAKQGQPFVVTVVTYGGGRIEKRETKVEVEALRVEVRPYDYDTTPAGGDCDDDLRYHKHTATLRFAEVGTAEVVFFGRKKNASGVTQVKVAQTLEVP